MEDLLRLLIEPLTTDISKIRIEKDKQDTSVNFTVFIPKGDIAKVIGKEGKMVKAIKNLLRIRAMKENVFATCQLQEY